jgi:saccharopine dehydrogenase (NAD+, L-lysine-forming)
MSGDAPERYPPPVGQARPMYTLHSEVATLPESFAEKGVREVSFKIAFDPGFLEKVRFLRDLGLATTVPIRVGGVEVSPIEVVNRIAMTQPKPVPQGPLRQHEIVRAVVKGRVGRKARTFVLDCHTAGMARWGVGADLNTGAPPAIAARMIAAGEISAVGALPPERAVPTKPFFEALKRRGLRIVLRTGRP